MEIIPPKPGQLILRFIFFFFVLVGLWSPISSVYAHAKMHALQYLLQFLYPSHPPFIRNPGFMQGYAVMAIVLMALVCSRWQKNNLHQGKSYPWTKLTVLFFVLLLTDLLGNLLELAVQRSSFFALNYAVTWLLSVGTITLPFLGWLFLEANIKKN